MKRKFKVLFMLCLAFIVPKPVQAEVTDTTAPTLTDYTLSKNEIKVGESIQITTNTQDDISGVKVIRFNFYDKSQDSTLFLYINTASGIQTRTTNEASKTNPGTYTLRTLEVEDGAGNSACYTTEEFKDEVKSCTNIIKSSTIKYIETQGAKYGHIKDIKISKQEINPKENVTFTVTVDDPDIESFSLLYNNGKTISFENPNHQTVLTKTFNGFDVSGETYKLYHIEIRNKNKMITKYSEPNQSQEGAEMIYDFDFAPYTIKVSGTKDTIAPTLNSISIETPKVNAPGILKLKINATDDIKNNLSNIKFNYRLKGQTIKAYGFSLNQCKGSDNGYTCQVEIDQYMTPGVYEFYSIGLFDKSNNSVYYMKDPYDENRPLIPLEFEISTEMKSDLVSSTENQEVIEKILNEKDDATITLDSTSNPIVSKDIFNAIRGTNKKLYIESNGIQWIFNGSKITNETKDINTKVNIYKNYESEKKYSTPLDETTGLVIKFEKNGLLPGVAKVRIKADYAFREFIGTTNLEVYYLDEQNELLDPVAKKIEMTEDGYYEFYIEHNSTYIITNKTPDVRFLSDKTDDLKLNEEVNTQEFMVNEENKEETYETNLTVDNKKSNILLIVIFSTVAVLLILAIIFRKKIMNLFKKKESSI
ncbi:MAG: hypothetical protein E7159_04905 [Firmicutes bacterium]|nr:hypothetical protein [Bacillota bacterium]